MLIERATYPTPEARGIRPTKDGGDERRRQHPSKYGPKVLIMKGSGAKSYLFALYSIEGKSHAPPG